jgi:N6-adenosine-specific RNA methylase IME4
MNWGAVSTRLTASPRRFRRSLEQACTLDIASLLTPDVCVWMWTNCRVSRGPHRHVLDAWGLQAKTMLTWGKTKFCGDWLRGQTEHAILAVRGKPAIKTRAPGNACLSRPTTPK